MVNKVSTDDGHLSPLTIVGFKAIHRNTLVGVLL
jgi:hypothetical protein